jgi:hypothetical protein
MADQENIHLSRTDARSGSSNHVTRYVLPISLALVVILFAIIVSIWW